MFTDKCCIFLDDFSSQTRLLRLSYVPELLLTLFSSNGSSWYSLQGIVIIFLISNRLPEEKTMMIFIGNYIWQVILIAKVTHNIVGVMVSVW